MLAVMFPSFSWRCRCALEFTIPLYEITTGIDKGFGLADEVFELSVVRRLSDNTQFLFNASGGSFLRRVQPCGENLM
jgi:hypothetical protein